MDYLLLLSHSKPHIHCFSTSNIISLLFLLDPCSEATATCCLPKKQNQLLNNVFLDLFEQYCGLPPLILGSLLHLLENMYRIGLEMLLSSSISSQERLEQQNYSHDFQQNCNTAPVSCVGPSVTKGQKFERELQIRNVRKS